MSRNTKIILGVTASVLAFCGLACIALLLLLPRLAQNAVSTGPNKTQNVGKQIAEYTVPAGYKQQAGVDLFIEKFVVLMPDNQRGPVITLFQVNSPNASRDQVQRQMEQAFAQGAGNQANYHEVGTRTVTIKGQSTLLTVSESDAGARTSMRQAIGVFKGKGGIAMVMFVGEPAEWDWRLVEDFCASIK